MTHTGEQAESLKSELIPTKVWGQEISVDENSIREHLSEIQNSIVPCKPKIIGVTKYFGLNAIEDGYKAGLRDFGESRAIDGVNKIKSLSNEIRNNSTFHFIGHLQTNKAEKVVEYFDYIHSVDSLKLAKVISEAACRLDKREKVLLQVNKAEEVQKFGYDEQTLTDEFEEILNLESLEVVGLMCMAPLGANELTLRNLFSDMRKLKNKFEQRFGVELPELSMGMSDDYKIAVQEGATMIRIGRKLFK